MNHFTLRVRRATVEDQANLAAMWEAMRFDVVELDKQLTHFQLVESGDGELIGAIKLDHSEKHGKISHEAFNHFEWAERGRELLWERLKSLSLNLGLVRLWCAESAPFWRTNGFLPATQAALSKKPAAWREINETWSTLQLRDEEAIHAALSMEFSHLQEEERILREAAVRRGKTIKVLGTLLIALIAVAGMVLLFYLLRHPNLFKRH